MKIPKENLTLSLDELKIELEDKFNTHHVHTRRYSHIVVKKSATVGVFITYSRKYIEIRRGLPTRTARWIFYLIILVLGIILPIILYYILLNKNMKKFENEIVNYIKLQGNFEKI